MMLFIRLLTGFGDDSNSSLLTVVRSVSSLEDPLQDPAVLTKSRPHELASLLPEPVHVEDLKMEGVSIAV